MTFKSELQQQIAGDVYFDAASRNVWSQDASIYQVKPIGIVLPKTAKDVQKAVAIARKHGAPIIPRGAATGTTGGCLGKGLVIDTSTYMNQILEINWEKGYAVCEPGVIQDDLNKALAKRGFRLGPDTSTGNVATLGGMLGNNAAGTHSLLYGMMQDHIEKVELVLSDGSLVTTDDLIQKLLPIQKKYMKAIEREFPKTPRRASGYNLSAFLEEPLNPAKLLAGSEGTLGVITKLQVKIVPIPKKTVLSLFPFESIHDAMEAVTKILQLRPHSLELIDDKIIKAGRESPTLRGKMEWLQSNPKALLVAELESPSPDGITISDEGEKQNVWALRKGGLGLLLSKRSYSRAVGFIEDMAVPPENLAPFTQDLLHYFREKDLEAGIYGHAGAGCLHIRPYLDLRKQEDKEKMVTIMEDMATLLQKYGGVLSGEHGDGMIRSWLNKKIFGDTLYEVMVEVKSAFDPENRMNPGKVVEGKSPLENLRVKPPEEPETFLDFSKEGGLALSADLCNGNGLCRKREGLMCPSFQATGNEFDTTRARATAIRAFHLQPTKEVVDVLDLCLECKGCKTECPSQVDMAKMKSEILYQYQKKHGFPLRSTLFAHVGKINQLFSPIAPLYNWISQTAFAKQLLDWQGVTKKRTLPPLAKKRFTKSFQEENTGNPPVVLFVDTFSEFHCPEVAEAAVSVLRYLGFSVIVPKWTCCGRTYLSKGFLPQAKKRAEKVVETLFPFAKEGIPIVGLEPSCILTIIDDYTSLLPGKKTETVIQACHLFESFVTKQNPTFPPCEQEILLHGHCHQKALGLAEDTKKMLEASPGTKVIEIPSGCCGLAGSFGYEKEHYDLSLKIANLKLTPALQKNSLTTVANGFSCRCQIEHISGAPPLHPAQILKDC